MKRFFLSIFVVVQSMLTISAQTDTINFEYAKYLVEEERYSEAIKYIDIYEKECNNNESDSVRMQFNYIKGSALYFMERYEEALPYLNNALLEIEKLPHEDCIFLEIIYGIGSCYKELKQNENAEKYFRRVIIRGRTLDGICAITTQTLLELTEIYSEQGNNELAKKCTEQIQEFIKSIPSDNWQIKIESLSDLADSYKILKLFDKMSSVYKEILGIIEENKTKNSDDYILNLNFYASNLISLAMDFFNTNQTEKAISKFEEAKKLLPQVTDNTKVYFYSQYGFFQIKCENYVNAIDFLKKGIDLCQKSQEENYIELATMFHNLGRAYMLKQDFDNALKYLNKSKSIQMQLNGNVMQRTLDYIKDCESK